MIRTILVDVTGEFITKNSKLAGSQGSANSVRLSILFSEAWDGYTKRAIFYNARGENPVAVVLGEPDGETGRHEVPIPGEPLEFGGWLSYKLEGLDGDETPASIVLTVTDTLYVEPGNTYHTPAEPTPSQALQLNERIDAHLSDHENPHRVTKAQVGLSEADNTADMDKPLSIPQSEAMETMLAVKADKAETYTKAEIGAKLNMEAGAVASISGISNAAGDIALEAGTGIRVTPNPAAKKLLIEATGESIPAAHGHTHEPGGSDPLFIPRGASDIDFDNEDTGLTSTTAQEAIAELAARPVSASMMAADMQKGVPGGVAAYDDVKSLGYSGTTSGTATALALPQPGFTLTDGATVRIKLHTPIGAGATLNVAGTGAKAIADSKGAAVAAGAPAGTWLTLVYNGTKWVVQGDGFGFAPKVGDTITTMRTDLSDDWLLCNGQKVSETDYPDLFSILLLNPDPESWKTGTQNTIPRFLKFLNGWWVTVAAVGTSILVKQGGSPDGAWSQVLIASSTSVMDIEYANGYWAIITSNNGLFYRNSPSPNGSWTKHPNFSYIGQRIKYANGYWCVARGHYVDYRQGELLGGGFTAVNVLQDDTIEISAINFVQGYWVVGSSSGFGHLYYREGSPAGSWTHKDNLMSVVRDIYEANGYCVFSTNGGARCTTDLTTSISTWQLLPSSAQMFRYGGGYWVASVFKTIIFKKGESPVGTWRTAKEFEEDMRPVAWSGEYWAVAPDALSSKRISYTDNLETAFTPIISIGAHTYIKGR